MATGDEVTILTTFSIMHSHARARERLSRNAVTVVSVVTLSHHFFAAFFLGGQVDDRSERRRHLLKLSFRLYKVANATDKHA
jgi:hypothetical protein